MMIKEIYLMPVAKIKAFRGPRVLLGVSQFSSGDNRTEDFGIDYNYDEME